MKLYFLEWIGFVNFLVFMVFLLLFLFCFLFSEEHIKQVSNNVYNGLVLSGGCNKEEMSILLDKGKSQGRLRY